MARDINETLEGGVLRDKFNRRILVVRDKHAIPDTNALPQNGSLTDPDGREEVVLQDRSSGLAINVLDWGDADPTGTNDSTSAVLAAQAEVRKHGHGATLLLPGLFVMTQPLQLMGGEQIEGMGYLNTGLQFAFAADGDCVVPRDPTDFTDFVRFANMRIAGDAVHTRNGILARSMRHLALENVEITGSSQFTQHGFYGYGQRWKDGTSTSGGATASVPPKTSLTSPVTAQATTLLVGDTSQYQPGPSILKLATQVTTLAANVGLADTTVKLADASMLSASGAIMAGPETWFYTSKSGATLNVIRPSGRVTHTAGEAVYVVELIGYPSLTSTSFPGCTRGINGTSAFAHTTGALAYQNPGDSTHMKLLGDTRILSGGIAAVRLGGTDGDVRLNSGQTNQTTLSFARIQNLSQAGATAALWFEKGNANGGFQTRIIGSTGPCVKYDWFGNVLTAPLMGPPGDGTMYVFDFGTNPEAHDNVVSEAYVDLVGGAMAGVHNDEVDCKNDVRVYRGGWHLNANPSGHPNLTKNSLWSKAGPGGAMDGYPRWRGRANGDDHRLLGAMATVAGRKDGMVAGNTYTLDAFTAEAAATLIIWQASCGLTDGNTLSGAFVEVFNETDATTVYSFASAAHSQGANSGANPPIARFTGLGGKRLSIRLRTTPAGPNNVVGKLVFSIVNGTDA